MDKIERLINLTAYLLDTRRPVTMIRLMDTVYSEQSGNTKALERMFERDKEELREMGINVETVRSDDMSEPGYIIPRDRYYLPHTDLEPEESIAIAMVSRFFLGSGTPFSGPAHSALLKLIFDRDQEIGEEDIPHVHWVGIPRDRKTLAAIIEGLRCRKVLKFSYRALDAKESLEREVDPYGLVSRKGFWYLVGWCHLREEIRCFKLDRMTSEVKVNKKSPNSPDFVVPPDFNLKKETDWDWPPARSEEVVATVVFNPKIAFIFGSAQAGVLSRRSLPDGSLEVTYKLEDPEGFVSWLLELGIGARIVAPAELVEMAKERLRGILSVAKAKLEQ